jgi:hypothetical protein
VKQYGYGYDDYYQDLPFTDADNFFDNFNFAAALRSMTITGKLIKFIDFTHFVSLEELTIVDSTHWDTTCSPNRPTSSRKGGNPKSNKNSTLKEGNSYCSQKSYFSKSSNDENNINYGFNANNINNESDVNASLLKLKYVILFCLLVYFLHEYYKLILVG